MTIAENIKNIKWWQWPLIVAGVLFVGSAVVSGITSTLDDDSHTQQQPVAEAYAYDEADEVASDVPEPFDYAPMSEAEFLEHMQVFDQAEVTVREYDFEDGRPRISLSLEVKPEFAPTENWGAEALGAIYVQRMIDWLIDEGFDPKNTQAFITAHMHTPAGNSPTGRAQYVQLGMSIYDFNADSIAYRAP